MSSSLPDNVWSPDDLAELMSDLERYNQWLSGYQVKLRVTSDAAATKPPDVSAASLAYLQMLHDKQALSTGSIERLLDELRAIELTAPRLNFTFAAPPSGGLKKTFVRWCRTHIAPNALISFQFNKTILGGMVVRYGSHIFDWSLRRDILANRDKFTEVLRRV